MREWLNFCALASKKPSWTPLDGAQTAAAIPNSEKDNRNTNYRNSKNAAKTITTEAQKQETVNVRNSNNTKNRIASSGTETHRRTAAGIDRPQSCAIRETFAEHLCTWTEDPFRSDKKQPQTATIKTERTDKNNNATRTILE